MLELKVNDETIRLPQIKRPSADEIPSTLQTGQGPHTKAIYRASNEAAKKLWQCRFPYQGFLKDYFLKWFDYRPNAEGELECLKTLAKSQYFHRFPWVHTELLEQVFIDATDSETSAPKDSKIEGFAIAMEYIGHRYKTTYNIKEHIKNLSGHDERLVLLLYCDALAQTLDTVKFMHSLTRGYKGTEIVGMFHCDIKPENVLFRNNLLKVIDFGSVCTQTVSPVFKVGTAPQLQGYALDRRLRMMEDYIPLNLGNLGVIDLHLTIMTFLEILATSLCDTLLLSPALCTAFYQKAEINHKKDEQMPLKDKYINFKSINNNIKDYIMRLRESWNSSRPPNRLLEVFSALEIQPYELDAYNKCKDRTAIPSTADLYRSTLDLRQISIPKSIPRWSLHGEVEPWCFAEHMEQLLATTTSNIFYGLYHLVYIDYSEYHGWYDLSAEFAAVNARKLLGSHFSEPSPTLDVGCAFGTAAFQAVENGFKDIYLLDNSPVFQRIADLLWAKQGDANWQRAAADLLTDEFLAIASIYRGETAEDVRTKFQNLLEDKRKRFSTHMGEGKVRDFLLMDFWALKPIPLRADTRPGFQYIVCSNFLHWPVIAFQALKDRTGDSGFCEININKRSHIKYLLYPLLNALALSGVIVIIEPTLFFSNDEDVHDEDYHQMRFTMQQPYRDVLLKINTELLEKHGIASRKEVEAHFKPSEDLPNRHIDKKGFIYSDIREYLDKDYPRYTSKCIRKCFAKEVEWKRFLLGEYAMTTHGFPEAWVKNMTADPIRFKNFYEELAEVVERMAPEKCVINECFYFTFIGDKNNLDWSQIDKLENIIIQK